MKLSSKITPNLGLFSFRVTPIEEKVITRKLPVIIIFSVIRWIMKLLMNSKGLNLPTIDFKSF